MNRSTYLFPLGEVYKLIENDQDLESDRSLITRIHSKLVTFKG